MDGAEGNRNCRDARASIRQRDRQISAVGRLPAFQRLDDDGDAVVTREEFLEPFARLVQRLDRNADGAVTQEEMRAQREEFRDRRGDRRELIRRLILAVGRYRADVRT